MSCSEWKEYRLDEIGDIVSGGTPSTKNEDGYEDVQGYCKVASIDEIKEHDYILTPGRYVGIEDVEDDGEPFEEKMERLTKTLSEQFAKSRELEDEIRKQLGGIGYELQ